MVKIVFFTVLSLVVTSVHSFAGSVIGNVTDQDGKKLEHALISLVGDSDIPITENVSMPPPEMSQHNIQFSPFVLPVAKGTTVSFPNKDKIRHHVYSFSKVKRFELELYGGDEEKQVQFDVEGVVALGCNIHDNMLAYIYVAKSNLFATSNDAGTVSISDLKAGNYKAYVWHPRMSDDEEKLVKDITVTEDGTVTVDFQVSLKRERRRNRRSNY